MIRRRPIPKSRDYPESSLFHHLAFFVRHLHFIPDKAHAPGDQVVNL